MQISEISYNTIESDIKEHFKNYGEIAHIDLWKNEKSRRAIAFVQFKTQEALDIISELKNSVFQGKIINISIPKSARQEGSLKEGKNSKIVKKFNYFYFFYFS